MKKKFNVVNVDCADCAAKMEKMIKKIEGVNDARLNFLTQKLTIDANDENFDEIVKEADECLAKVDYDAHIDI